MDIEEILRLFLYNNKLKFNEIEKSVKIRSNKLTYHLKKLMDKGVLEKENEYYKLSESSEFLIPYISNKKAVLPVVLILIGDDKKAFLFKREKRPYKGKMGLPGGRILLGESINDSVERIMKEKFNMKCKLEEVNSISLEHIKKNKKTIHSFMLIFVKAKTKEKIQLTDLEKEKKKIISSDYKLIKKDSGKEIKIKNINSGI